MKNKITYIIILIVLIIVWQYFGSNNQTVRLFISSPSLIVDYFSENRIELIEATYTTLLEALTGLLIATCFSFLMMILCFAKPKFMDFILPVMVTSQVIPVIVLAPFFIILFGIGLCSKIAMAAIISFFPVFVNFAQGYKAISRNIHELMSIYEAPLSFRIKNVYFPLAMPSIMAGLKVSATLAVIGAIVAEFTGAETGLGKNLFISAIRLEPDLMMSSLILSTIIGLGLFGIVKAIENKLGKWYQDEKGLR
ncbi:MAG: ABC transporter permease [Flavobacterium sp.]|nr:MAG: ABC transporter permease [Flavobacterium sp.]